MHACMNIALIVTKFEKHSDERRPGRFYGSAYTKFGGMKSSIDAHVHHILSCKVTVYFASACMEIASNVTRVEGHSV